MKNIYTENNKVKSRKGLIILIIFLIFIILGLIIYILYDKEIIVYKSKNKIELPESKLNSDELKIYSGYELVYDAEYSNEIKEKSYVDSKNNYRYLDDIVVPFININSDEILKLNEEIKILYDSLTKEYEENMISTDSYVKSNYTYVIFDNMISVLIKITRNIDNKEYSEYKTYNVDLEEKKLLGYENLYKKLSIRELDKKLTKDNIEILENTAIKLKTEEIIKEKNLETKEEYTQEIEDEKTKEIIKQTITKEKEFAGLTLEKWIESCTNEYFLTKKENTNKYFISKEGTLNIIVKLFNGEKNYSCSETSLLEINSQVYKKANIK